MSEVRILVHTDAFDESVAFYGTLLGMPVTIRWDAEGAQGRGTIFAASDDARVELIEGGTAPTGLTLSIETDDVDAVAARLGDRLTVPLTVQPWGHRSCATADPNGIAIVFFEVMADDPAVA